MTHADYRQLDSSLTRVTGSKWRKMPYTMKLEGARGGDFQTIMLIGIEDPAVLASLDAYHDRLNATLMDRIKTTFKGEAPTAGIMADPRFGQALRHFPRLGLSFDAWLYYHSLANLSRWHESIRKSVS